MPSGVTHGFPAAAPEEVGLVSSRLTLVKSGIRLM
jgi:hypothetical protein